MTPPRPSTRRGASEFPTLAELYRRMEHMEAEVLTELARGRDTYVRRDVLDQALGRRDDRLDDIERLLEQQAATRRQLIIALIVLVAGQAATLLLAIANRVHIT